MQSDGEWMWVEGKGNVMGNDTIYTIHPFNILFSVMLMTYYLSFYNI